MTAAAAAITVDARGLRCPWPALRAARAARAAGAGATLRVLADDPAAARELAALAAERGWGFATIVEAAAYQIAL